MASIAWDVFGAIMKGLAAAGQAIFLVVALPFQFFLGRIIYRSKELARELEQPFFPSEPEKYADPNKSGWAQVLIAFSAFGDVIRGIAQQTGNQLPILAIPIVIALLVLAALYVLMLIAPAIIFVLGVIVNVVTVGLQAAIVVYNTYTRPFFVLAAPIWNTILTYLWKLALGIFHLICPGPIGPGISPLESCPVLDLILRFILQSWDILMQIATLAVSTFISVYAAVGQSICPGFNPDGSSGGVCPSSFCTAVGDISPCGFDPRRFATWALNLIGEVLRALLPIVEMLFAFGFDILSGLISLLFQLFTGDIFNKDPGSADIIRVTSDALLHPGSYVQSLIDNGNMTHLGQLPVEPPYQPLKNVLLAIEGILKQFVIWVIVITGDLLVILNSIICNVFHDASHCILGKLCYATKPFGLFYGLFCIPQGIVPVGGGDVVFNARPLLCDCDRCKLSNTLFGKLGSALSLYSYVNTPGYPLGTNAPFTFSASTGDMLVPCVFHPVTTGVNQNCIAGACGVTISVLMLLVPF